MVSLPAHILVCTAHIRKDWNRMDEYVNAPKKSESARPLPPATGDVDDLIFRYERDWFASDR
jgi:hypothetical protein